MRSVKRKQIVISLVLAFIIFLICSNGIEDNSREYPEAPLTIPSHLSFDSERIYSVNSLRPQPQSNHNRQEVLKTNVKGYREATYWGSEHPIDEKIRHQDDDEFDRYIEEEVKLKDAEVYWGAEY